VSSVEFEHFRFPADEGDPATRLAALAEQGWEPAGAPRHGVDLSGRRVLVCRMRRFPELAPRLQDVRRVA
jgi:hypothetical protein